MSGLSFMNYAVGISAVVATIAWVVLVFYAVKALIRTKKVLNDVESTTHDIKVVKDEIKTGAIGTLGFLINMLRGGGE